jgi:feruloyl-CoA synthase
MAGALRRPADVPFRPLEMRRPNVAVQRRADGTIILTSRLSEGARPRSIPHCLDQRAASHSARPWIRQRREDGIGWREITYGDGARRSLRVADALLRLGLGPARPLCILSGNSIEHAVVAMAAMRIRAPVVAISEPYSRASHDYEKLRHCLTLVRPGAVFVQRRGPFEPALAAIEDLVESVISCDAAEGAAHLSFQDLERGSHEGGAVEAEMAAIDDATVAKIMFTSGSTDLPKGVIQTQGNLCAQIAARNGVDLPKRDPDHVSQWLEWMPWSHASAGNIGFNAVLWSGATLNLDSGKPAPGLFDETIRNLREVRPSAFGSAPIAYAMLADALEQDLQLRRAFFEKLEFLSYGGAALPKGLSDRLQALAIAETGLRIPFISMFGSTETQGITLVHWEAEAAGLIGVPLPGVQLKLLTLGDRFEVRAKGPTVTPGYVGDAAKTAAAFDEEGFFKLGDAARFFDPKDPSQGLAFAGRLAEDFKLATGTWVPVSALRTELIEACAPWLQDAVITGVDQAYVAALLWPSTRALGDGDEPLGEKRERLRALLKPRLEALCARQSGSSRRIRRAWILLDPPSLQAGEITDKGYVNQRIARSRRRADIEALHNDPPPPLAIVL